MNLGKAIGSQRSAILETWVHYVRFHLPVLQHTCTHILPSYPLPNAGPFMEVYHQTVKYNFKILSIVLLLTVQSVKALLTILQPFLM